VNTWTVSGEQVRPAGAEVSWPVRAGAVPPLADGFSTRPETAPALGDALGPGATVVLAPGGVAAEGSRDWLVSCGKTQLAVSHAEWLWRTRKVDLIVWVVATSRASVLSGYVEAAVAAMGTDPTGDAESVAARFISWLAETRRPWIVVLDDLSDEADLEGLRPEGPSGRVLITTRNSATVSREPRAVVLPVGGFSPREAVSYLMGRLTADTDQRIGAIDLVQGVGCEPLALAQASAVIASSALSCRDYLGYFSRRREQMAEATGGQPPAAAITWTFSVEQAERLSPRGGAQSLLALAALLDGHGIPAKVFATPAARGYLAGDGSSRPTDRERAHNALVVLERAGLVATDPPGRPTTVRMSQVIQAAVRAVMPARTLDRAAAAAADALLAAWPENETGAWDAELLRSCTASLKQASGDLLWKGGCHPLLLRAGQSMDSARLAGPAVAYWRELAAVNDRLLGPDSPDTLVAGQRLAHAYLAANRAAEAVPRFEWALAVRTRTLGPNHPSTVAARRNLGRALVAANQFRDAVTVLDATVGDYERVRGTDHLDTFATRDELAAAASAAGQFDDAIRLYRRTLSDRERVQGPRHPDTMSTRQKLADAYLGDRRFKDALTQYKKVLSDRERILGADHLDTIAARGSLGAAYHAAGRMASALQMSEQAAAGYVRVLGADHPDTLKCRASLAHAYYAVGRITDAVTVLRDTILRCERVLPAGDPLTQTVRESLSNITGQ
jgi:tetratricopeptide (TPR) repeat protein